MAESESERRDWTRIEVEATVSAYVEMLLRELQGEPYNKTQNRRTLLRLLNNRTEGAIERKHQNISAILIEIGLPYIAGYKPLRNFQELLRNVVKDRVALTPALIPSVQTAIERMPLSVPIVDDILRFIVDPPMSRERSASPQVREMPHTPYVFRTNYLMREAQNSHLGRAGEEFVLNFERARLIADGQERLAARIEHVAVTKGDWEGFDVLSFSANGRERLIEVKTTGFPAYTPFFVTQNELETSKAKMDQYHVYRVFNFRRNPQLFILPGAIDQSCDLEPTQFVARVG